MEECEIDVEPVKNQTIALDKLVGEIDKKKSFKCLSISTAKASRLEKIEENEDKATGLTTTIPITMPPAYCGLLMYDGDSDDDLQKCLM